MIQRKAILISQQVALMEDLKATMKTGGIVRGATTYTWVENMKS